MIRVLKPGLLTTVQDLGRPGYQQYGVVVGGALDAFAARVANLIVGNDDNAALLEMAQTGPDLQFERAALVAWNGGDFEATIGGRPLLRDRAVRVEPGETLSFGVARRGLRAWLAVAGGLDVPLVMGSRSTYRRAGLGGHNNGRPLAAGDRLQAFAPGEWATTVLASLGQREARATVWTVRPETLGPQAPAGTVRAVIGPEWDWFNNDAQKALFASEWEATREADRMGVRLHGPELALHKPREMISSAVNTGIVQVPPSGQPIVLLPSRQSVGGYPRIAAVASVDVGRFTQLRPGEKVRFERMPLAVAFKLQLQRERDLGRVRMGLARLTG
ncbi:biotin-dependent carboxyltransferase family protein [Oleiharenicola lentus]|jgi:antagonist of KipI|uniref:Biotin-dependent carboxyltransferase family protein n=1 Tax=Oleiharenicola lentus TaxID=2508720 RepID=A0A4Q1C969_9BACT|nr:biotin-dependent carboxyltransferase family protein [Oleiharenicola lentus]RXK55525.1 biotin-dependent carboxyltransferase family protein [Oleiharenicola lentus]